MNTVPSVSAAGSNRRRWRRSLVAGGVAGLAEGSIAHVGRAGTRPRLEIAGGPCGSTVELAVDGRLVACVVLDPLGCAAVDLDVDPAVLARASIVVFHDGDVFLHASTTTEARR